MGACLYVLGCLWSTGEATAQQRVHLVPQLPPCCASGMKGKAVLKQRKGSSGSMKEKRIKHRGEMSNAAWPKDSSCRSDCQRL